MIRIKKLYRFVLIRGNYLTTVDLNFLGGQELTNTDAKNLKGLTQWSLVTYGLTLIENCFEPSHRRQKTLSPKPLFSWVVQFFKTKKLSQPLMVFINKLLPPKNMAFLVRINQ